MLQLVETILTLSGEAPLPGKPMFLVRFSHCNLSCSYCDTPHREEVNEEISRDELVRRIKKEAKEFPGLSVLFTGGEPLLEERQRALMKTVAELDHLKFFIETNGTILIEKSLPVNCHYVMDWKSESSGAARPFCLENLSRLRAGIDCIKLVAGTGDLPGLEGKIAAIHRSNPGLDIYISPQYGDISPSLLWDYIIENKLNVSLSLQLHKIVWGEKKGV